MIYFWISTLKFNNSFISPFLECWFLIKPNFRILGEKHVILLSDEIYAYLKERKILKEIYMSHTKILWRHEYLFPCMQIYFRIFCVLFKYYRDYVQNVFPQDINYIHHSCMHTNPSKADLYSLLKSSTHALP